MTELFLDTGLRERRDFGPSCGDIPRFKGTSSRTRRGFVAEAELASMTTGEDEGESSIRCLLRDKGDSSFIISRRGPSGGTDVEVGASVTAGGRSVTVILGPAGVLSSLLSMDKRSIITVLVSLFCCSGIPSTLSHSLVDVPR